ncbi:MAG: RluA family pseudouridine synthase [Gammaproteobacteria bacterium]
MQQSHQGVRYIAISDEYATQRIDNFLIRLLKGVPRSHVYRVLRAGEVRVNKKRVKPSYRLQSGDSVRVPPVNVKIQHFKQLGKPRQRQLLEQVLYEDAELLIINKPAGVPVHGGSGIDAGVVELLRQAKPEWQQLELVHRLDKGTSGCLMLAKKRSMLRALHDLLRQGAVTKYYLVLVAGQWPQAKQSEQRIDLPLLKYHLSSGEHRVKVSPEGKSAISYFTVVQSFKQTSLVRVRLETGRTHQIRVHAAHSGHPVIGDEKYGDAELNQYMKQRGCGRMFLHAEMLSLILPTTQQPLTVTAELTPNLTQLLKELAHDA